MKELYGAGVALVTPFKPDFSVDAESLERIVDFAIMGGAAYLVVLGTTAESVTLTEAEKEQVKAIVATANKGRVPMVLGIGGNNTAAIVKQLKTTDVTDYAAILSVSPYYNKPTQEGVYRHFRAVAENSLKPVLLYNVPGRTASNIAPQTALRLARDCHNIIGIKEAAGDIVQAMRLLKDKPKDFLVISGDDMITLPMIAAGAAGVISVVGGAFPTQFSKMVQLGLEGRIQEAYNIHYKLMEIIDLIFEEGNPAGVKAVFKMLGLTSDTVRLPLVEASARLTEKIAGFMAHFNS